MITAYLYLFILMLILVVFGSAVYAGFRAAPWLPVFKRDIARILKLADVNDDDKVYDLGSGDGRIVIAVANNTKARMVVGYEISMIPYIWSRLRVFFLGIGKKAEIRSNDFLRVDLSSANVVFCFLTPMAMKKLQPKFEKELKEGTRVVSYSFHIPFWEPIEKSQPDEYSMPIYKYIVGESDKRKQGESEHPKGVDWF